MRVSGSVDDHDDDDHDDHDNDHDDDDDDDDEREGWMRVSGSVKAQTRVDDLCHNCVAHTNTHHYVHTQIHTIM